MNRHSISTFLVLAGLSIAVTVGAQEPQTGQLSPQQTTQLGDLLDRDWENRPPWAEMAIMILQGKSMGNGTGWFTRSQRRHDWPWLVQRYPDAAADGQITIQEISELSRKDFNRVDQNRDRLLTEQDFRFDKNPLLEDESPAASIFSELDEDSNGRLTSKEMQRWFKRSSGDSDFLSIDDLKDALGLGPQPPRPPSQSDSPREDPRWKMLGMLLSGEMGSLSEGPELGADAPELDLPLVKRSEEGGELELTDQVIKLESFRSKKPVVLIFGSFT